MEECLSKVILILDLLDKGIRVNRSKILLTPTKFLLDYKKLYIRVFMKANELMINDWVQFVNGNKIRSRINCISPYQKYAGHTDNATWVYINGNLYEWIKHDCKFDEEESFYEFAPLEDGTIKIFAQFYNGGCCLEKLLEEKLK